MAVKIGQVGGFRRVDSMELMKPGRMGFAIRLGKN
jgi:hypothetical protein